MVEIVRCLIDCIYLLIVVKNTQQLFSRNRSIISTFWDQAHHVEREKRRLQLLSRPHFHLHGRYPQYNHTTTLHDSGR